MSTSVTIVQDQPPAPRPSQAVAETPKARRLQIRGKLKVALDLLVYGDDDAPIYSWDAAARKAGFTLRAMRYAMERPHVRQYLKAQRHVYLASASASNPRRLIELRDQDENRAAAVSAARDLEAMAEERNSAPGQRVSSPGVTIYIGTERPARDADKAMIEINPLSEHDNPTNGE